jgi:hypothetical protein
VHAEQATQDVLLQLAHVHIRGPVLSLFGGFLADLEPLFPFIALASGGPVPKEGPGFAEGPSSGGGGTSV